VGGIRTAGKGRRPAGRRSGSSGLAAVGAAMAAAALLVLAR
jgi:hypothetical protein